VPSLLASPVILFREETSLFQQVGNLPLSI